MRLNKIILSLSSLAGFILLFQSSLYAQQTLSPGNSTSALMPWESSSASSTDHSTQKAEWIKQHPEEYRKMQNNSASQPAVVDLPGFPKYTDTGNKEQDLATYKAAKEKWIAENPVLYQSVLSQMKNNADEDANDAAWKAKQMNLNTEK